MASVINQIKIGDVEYAIAPSAYAECLTASSESNKTATICTDGDTTNTSFTLIKGVSINVKFSNTNETTTPTLNINSTGAKTIQYRGASVPKEFLISGRVYTFVYDGTYWQIVTPADKWTLEALKAEVLNMVYPIGAIYISLNNVNPSGSLGGTWTQIASGRTLIGAGTTYTAGNEGGAASASFTLTSANMPSHTHSLSNHTHGLNGHTHSFTPSGTISSLSANTGSTALTTAANTGGLTAKSAGSHSHNVKWDIDGSGTGSQHVIRAEMNETKWGYMTTESAGSHSHSIDSHTHSISGHTHTMNHSHTFTGTQGTTGANNGSTAAPSNNTSGSAGQATPTAVTISTLQPYLVVYMWQRTA